MTWSARLIEQRFDAVYSSRGEEATIHRWLSMVPAGLIESRPRLLLAADRSNQATASQLVITLDTVSMSPAHARTVMPPPPAEIPPGMSTFG